MEISNELVEKAKVAKNSAEILALAKENGIEITADEAANYFAELHKMGELSDNELNNVVGGNEDCGNGDMEFADSGKKYNPSNVVYEFNIGDRVEVRHWLGFSKRGTIKDCRISFGSDNRYFPIYDVQLDCGEFLKGEPQENIAH